MLPWPRGFLKATIYFLPIDVPLFLVTIFFPIPKNLQLQETGWTPIYDNEITQQFCFENGASFWNCRILDAMTRDTEKEKFSVLFARKKYKKLQSWWSTISCIFIIRAYKAICGVQSFAFTFPCNYTRSGVVFENVDELSLLTLKHYGRRYHVSLTSLRGEIVKEKNLRTAWKWIH